MDIPTLAKDMAECITPVLPCLLKIGEGTAHEAGKRIAGAAWDKVVLAWQLLTPYIEKRPSLKEAVADAASQPADADACETLRIQLKKALMSSPELAGSLREAWNDATGQSIKTSRGITVGRDVSNSVLVVGNENTVEQSP